MPLSSSTRRKPRAAFTVIELIIVVAIVLILLSLLFPAINSGKARARLATCTSHLRQIHGAMVGFAGDNEGRLHPSPNHGNWLDASGNRIDSNAPRAYWGVAYDNVAHIGRTMWRCPDAGDQVDAWYESDIAPYRTSTYGLNRYAIKRSFSRWQSPTALVLVQDAAEQVLDGYDDTLAVFPGNSRNLPQWRDAGRTEVKFYPNAPREWFRHASRCNTLWMDGHTSLVEEGEGALLPVQAYTGGLDIVENW